jgi:hypothetical protein
LIPPLVDARLEVSDVEGLVELVDELDRGDERDRATAAPLRAMVDPASGGSRPFAELGADVDAAQPVLEGVGDWMGAARCERARAQLAWAECQAMTCHQAMLRCREHLRRAGSTAWQGDLCTNIPASAVFAGLHVRDVAAIVDELEQDVYDAGPLLTVGLRAARARFDCQAGVLGIDEARAVILEYADLLRQVGSALEAHASSGILVVFAFFEGPEEYERAARERVERFEALGDRTYLANALGDWAAALSGLGRAHEALDAIARGRAIGRRDDLADAATLDVSEAYARALLGDRKRAEHLLERTHETLGAVDMAMVVDYVRRIEASARAALGDVDAAGLILTSLAHDADRRGFARFAQAYRHQLAALDRSSPD